MSLESRLSSGATERAALDSMARYLRRTSFPSLVTRAPPPPSPPVSVSTSGRRNAEFIASTSSQARLYDIFISRAAAEIDPVRVMAPSKSALPGPMATIAPMRMRIFGTSARDMGLKKSTPFAQEMGSQYSSTLGDCRLPIRRCPVQALRVNVESRAADGHRQVCDIESAPRARQPRRGISLLAEARPHQLRRTDGADRDHAPGSRRAETLDLREEISSRAQLLHAPAGTGSPAARYLYRLDDAPDLGWSDLRGPFRIAIAFHPDRVDLGLPLIRKHAAGRRAVLRNQAGRHGDRPVRGVSDRVARTQECGAVGDQPGCVRGDLRLPRAVSLHRARRRHCRLPRRS